MLVASAGYRHAGIVAAVRQFRCLGGRRRRILARMNYVHLEEHRRAHAGLRRRAKMLQDEVRSGKARLGAVVEFLAQDVVARHMIAVDRAFFPLFSGQPGSAGLADG